MEADAQTYSELNKSQIEAGTKFIDELSLSPGSKVLDMGCGTGEITKYISDVVGSEGKAVGIDPDAARIKIAAENFKGVSNLEYRVGDSANGFPHEDEPYYDAHVGTMAFHWVPPEEKRTYIRKAHRCLKPGGKLGILCLEQQPGHAEEDFSVMRLHMLTQDGYRKLFEEVGVFTDVVLEKIMFPLRAESLAEFKRWVKASTHHDLDELDPAFQKETMDKFVTTHEDGSISLSYPALTITATKT